LPSAELQPVWKQALAAASAPLDAAQKASLERRHAMIEEATALGAAPALRIDAIKALQQRWQAEAQAVPLDRKQEQRLWDAFRKPIDEAFNRKSAQRERTATELSARDRAVLDASKALEAANAGGDAQQIRSAMAALEAALRSQAEAQSEEKTAPAQEGEGPAQAAPESAAGETAEAPKAAPRPVVAVRGDDRPGMKKDAPAAPRAWAIRPSAPSARPWSTPRPRCASWPRRRMAKPSRSCWRPGRSATPRNCPAPRNWAAP
jgi:predicted secreted protein